MKTRLGALFALALFAAGCFDSPYSRTVEQLVPVSRVPADSAMGTLLLELDASRQVAFGQRPGRDGVYVFVAAWGGWNEDLTLASGGAVHGFHLPRGGGAPEPVPAWPMASFPAEGDPPAFTLGQMLGGDGVVVAQQAAEGFEVAVLRDGAWSAAGAIPFKTPPRRLVARSEREVLARGQEGLWAWDGSLWRRVAAEGCSEFVIGPWDGALPTLVFRDAADRLCTGAFGFDGAPRGEPACAEAPPGAILDDAIGGAAEALHVLLSSGGQARIVRRVGGAWKLGEVVALLATQVSAGGAPLVACTPGDGSIIVPACATLVDGAPAAWTGGFVPQVVCSGCSRETDPACGCVERRPTVSQYLSLDAAEVSLAVADTVDARTRLYFSTYPLEGAPPVPLLPPQACASLQCPEGWSCVAEAGAARCQPDGPGDALPQGWAWLTGTFSTADPADEGTLSLEVVALDGGLFEVRDGPPQVRVEVQVDHAYRLELSAPGYAPLSQTVEVGGGGEDLFTLVLARPERLGAPMEAQAAVSPAGGAMALAAGGRWLFVREEGEGGLAVVDLGEALLSTEAPSRPRFSPDGSLLLVPGSGPSTPVFDGQTGASLGALEGWVAFERIGFARDAAAMVVPARSNQPGTAQPAAVVGWSEAGLQTLFEASNPGLADALDPSGRWLARMEAGEVAVYDLSSWQRTSFVGAYHNPQGARVLVGAGPGTVLVGLAITGTCGEGTTECSLYVPDPATPGMMRKVADDVLRFWADGGGAVLLRAAPAVELLHLDLASGGTQLLAAGRLPDGREYAGAAGPRLFAVDAEGALRSWRLDTGAAEPADTSRAWTSVAPGPGADLLVNAGEADLWTAIARGTDGVLELPDPAFAEGLRFGSAHDRFGRVDAQGRRAVVTRVEGEVLLSRSAPVRDAAGAGARAPCFLYERDESRFGEAPQWQLYCSR